MVDLLEVIDNPLLAIVQLIVAIGLYELFIGALAYTGAVAILIAALSLVRLAPSRHAPTHAHPTAATLPAPPDPTGST